MSVGIFERTALLNFFIFFKAFLDFVLYNLFSCIQKSYVCSRFNTVLSRVLELPGGVRTKEF